MLTLPEIPKWHQFSIVDTDPGESQRLVPSCRSKTTTGPFFFLTITTGVDHGLLLGRITPSGQHFLHLIIHVWLAATHGLPDRVSSGVYAVFHHLRPLLCFVFWNKEVNKHAQERGQQTSSGGSSAHASLILAVISAESRFSELHVGRLSITWAYCGYVTVV